jgi:hypothetical protein
LLKPRGDALSGGIGSSLPAGVPIARTHNGFDRQVFRLRTFKQATSLPARSVADQTVAPGPSLRSNQRMGTRCGRPPAPFGAFVHHGGASAEGLTLSSMPSHAGKIAPRFPFHPNPVRISLRTQIRAPDKPVCEHTEAGPAMQSSFLRVGLNCPAVFLKWPACRRWPFASAATIERLRV